MLTKIEFAGLLLYIADDLDTITPISMGKFGDIVSKIEMDIFSPF